MKKTTTTRPSATAAPRTRVLWRLLSFLLLLFLLGAGPNTGWAQTPFTGIYEFTGNEDCPTTNDDVTTQPSEATFSTFARTAVTCQNPSDDYNNKDWTTSSTIDTNEYVSFTVTANATFALDFSTSDDLTFDTSANAQGPASGEVQYSVDGGSFQTLGAYTPESPATLNMPAISAATSVAFRFHAWNANNSAGQLAFDNVQLTGTTSPPLPVELVAFKAVADGRDVLLAWQTASETNNAGFEIQHTAGVETLHAPSLPWESLAFVEGYGSTELPQTYQYRVDDLAPGRHVFRLKQIDFDGTFEYHPEVEVVVEIVERFVVEPVYPNPFNPEAQFRFAVRQAQQVRVELYDMLGRRVKVVYAGEAPAGQMQVVRIDGSDLPSGLYVVRVAGKTFVKAQTVTLIK